MNNYFRKGKRSNSVSLEKRLTPTEFGGLGQLDVKAQINNLLSKWAIRSIGGDTHPWNIFWENNIDQLKRYLGSPTHPMFLEAAWPRKRQAKHLFHMMIPVYKAWHALKLPIRDLDFNTISPMPIFNNKFITNGIHSIEPNVQIKAIVHTLWREHGECITMNTLYEEVTLTPIAPFDSANKSTWRYTPKNPAVLNQTYGTHYTHAKWIQLRAQIPASIVQTMIKGHTVTVGDWGAINDGGEIADIYYVYEDNSRNSNKQLAYFDFNDDEHDSPISLKYTSENSGANSNEWDDWENAILPDLIPIRVSAIQGKPRPLGFTRSSFGADMFLVHRRVNSREEAVDIEKSIATSFHSNVLGNISTTQYKPHFNTLFKKVRKLPYKLLPQLESWPPSQEESAGGNEINWAKRMKVIMNCPFMMPKYRQLVYWITTKTLMDGKRLKHMPLSSSKGVCPFCNVSAEIMY